MLLNFNVINIIENRLPKEGGFLFIKFYKGIIRVLKNVQMVRLHYQNYNA